MSDNDDVQIGRILSRREILGLVGAAGAAALLVACGSDGDSGSTAATATSAPGGSGAGPTATSSPSTGANAASTMPACVVRPEVTEGPYFVDEKLNRSDIRGDPANNNAMKPGALLTLTFNVGQVTNGCTPLANAQVDVWHCDALGVYSDVVDRGSSTVGQKFLRGYQMTDSSGKVTFTTVYPGWYQGRAVHIHFKIRSGNAEFTSQIFFDDAVSSALFTSTAPYSQKGTNGITLNARDGIYKSGLLAPVTKSGDAYAASFDVGLQRV